MLLCNNRLEESPFNFDQKRRANMGLKPLEFSEALLDSPYFRENIHEHEKELERTNDAIKLLIKECKSLIKAIERK